MFNLHEALALSLWYFHFFYYANRRRALSPTYHHRYSRRFHHRAALVWPHVWLLLFASIMLSILWRNAGEWISDRTGLSRGVSIAGVIVLQFGLTVLAFVLLAPQVSAQMEVLINKMPGTLNTLKQEIAATRTGGMIMERIPDDQNLLYDSEVLLDRVVEFSTLTLGVVLDIIVIVVVALFLTLNPSLYVNGFVSLIPLKRRARARQVLQTLNITLFRWFVGQIVDVFLVGVMTAIGLWALGMPLVLTFALLAFFLSFIPNIGPVLSAVPPMLVALLDGPSSALWVGVLYLSIQSFESYVITPNIQQHAIRMPPVLLLLVQVFFAFTLGTLALLLATPLLAAAIVLVRMLYIEDTLGDRPDDPDVDLLLSPPTPRATPKVS